VRSCTAENLTSNSATVAVAAVKTRKIAAAAGQAEEMELKF
jgi:hypothetical protein